MPEGLVRKVVVYGLCAALLVSGVLLVRFYKERSDNAVETLQRVTNELTSLQDEYDRYVTEQSLLNNLLELGAKHKDESKVKTDEAIQKHRSSGSPVLASPADASLLYERSRAVRDAATGAKPGADQPR